MVATVIIGSMIAALVGFILYRSIKRYRSGDKTCGCGCSSCSLASKCHPK